MVTVLMPELHVGRGSRVGPLTVFPLWATDPGAAGLVTGPAARVAVAEREGAPVVEELVLTNRGPRPALLVDGELLEGGWQHRVLTHDVIVAVGGSLVADVACVEAGRWQGGTRHDRRARRASGFVRAALQGAPDRVRQQEVWQRVAACEHRFGTSSTSSFVDHLDRMARPESDGGDTDVTDLVREAQAVRPLTGQCGVLVGVAGHPVLLEVFPSTPALAAHLPGLLTGVFLDAVTTQAPDEVTPSRRSRRLVEHLDGRRLRVAHGVDAGAGTAVQADTDTALVRGIAVDDTWAHLSVLNRRHPLLAAA